MRLGICTKYCHDESAYAALRVGDWATARGVEVEIYSNMENPPQLGVSWDQQLFGPRSMRITQWMKRQDAIIWTYVPPKTQLTWVQKQGVATIGLLSWHSLTRDDRDVCRIFDIVVMPHSEAARLLRERWRIRTIAAIKWNIGVPPTAKDHERPLEPPSILFPLHDRNCDCIEMTLLNIIDRALGDGFLTATISYTPSQWAPAALRQLRGLEQKYEALSLAKSPPLSQRVFLYRAHDLTVWPTHATNYGLEAVYSVAAGTPVLAFGVSPLTEIVHSKNGVLLPCERIVSNIGASIAVPNYDDLEATLTVLIREPERIRLRERTTLEGAKEQQKIFDNSWARVLGV